MQLQPCKPRGGIVTCLLVFLQKLDCLTLKSRGGIILNGHLQKLDCLMLEPLNGIILNCCLQKLYCLIVEPKWSFYRSWIA